jgi:hypothetical protein
MIGAIRHWIEHRRTLRLLWQTDARRLIQNDEDEAYYVAQRLAARARAAGDRAGFLHWAKVAAEVARLSTRAKMELSVVQSIVDDELRARPTKRQ